MQTHSPENDDVRISDLKSGHVPSCLYWTCEEVCDFFENTLNLPEYKVS